MASKPRAPSAKSISFDCPHCGTRAHQIWHDAFLVRLDGVPDIPDLNNIGQLLDRYYAGGSDPKARERGMAQMQRLASGELLIQAPKKAEETDARLANLFVSQCYACHRFAVWIHRNVVYPPRRHAEPPNDDLPDDIKADFEEAATVLPLSPRSAAALLRLCIQKLCGHLGESGKDLNADIGNLVEKGLHVRIQQALDIVRVIGNEAVHPGVLDLRDDIDTAAELFALVNLIADVMITQPKRVDAMYEKLPATKRTAIEERDKKA